MPENRLVAGEKEEPTLAEKRTCSPLLWTTDHMPTNTRSTPPKAATIFVPVSTTRSSRRQAEAGVVRRGSTVLVVALVLPAPMGCGRSRPARVTNGGAPCQAH